METSTLTCPASRWARLCMLWLLMLVGIFERTVRHGFTKIFRCHCHLLCQICFGLGDDQDTQRFSNIGVSLVCSHYFYTKVCYQMTSGGDLCHVGASKLNSETNRWIDPCVIQFLPESRSGTMLHHWPGNGKYTTVLCFGTCLVKVMPGTLAHLTLGLLSVSETFYDVLSRYVVEVCNSCNNSTVTVWLD